MYVTHLSCPKCNNTYASEALTQVCTCGSPLLIGIYKALRELQQMGWINAQEKVVLLNTGSGRKYPETVTVVPPVLEKGDILPPVNSFSQSVS